MSAKSINDIRGRHTHWNHESAVWYEKASEYTDYHKFLTEYIKPDLDADDDCCEIACGTGTLGKHLAPFVKSYTLNDIDENAISFINENLPYMPANIRVLPGDWRSMLQHKQFDVILFSFYGAVFQNWEKLVNSAHKKIIIVAPRSFSHTASLKSYLDSCKSDDSSPDKKTQESFDLLCSYFDYKGIKYKSQTTSLEFGQPLTDKSDAENYVKYYYNIPESDIDEFIDLKCIKEKNGLYFPKKKDIGIITIKSGD